VIFYVLVVDKVVAVRSASFKALPDGMVWYLQILTNMASNNRLRRFTALSLLVVPIQSLQTTSRSASRPPLATPLDSSHPGHRNVPCRTPIHHGATANGCGSHTVRSMHTMKKRRVSVSLYAGRDHMESDEELMENLFKDSAPESKPADISEAAETKQIPSHFIQGKAAIGIGGNSGFVYNVNALKRNLVQESVKRCKGELLVLLEDGRQTEAITIKSAKDRDQTAAVSSPIWRRDRDDLIEERLSALVQVCSSIRTISNNKPSDSRSHDSVLFLITLGKSCLHNHRFQPFRWQVVICVCN